MGANLNDKFLFYSFEAFRTALVREKAADCHMLPHAAQNVVGDYGN